nr:discoidin domain-containing protein [Polaribacter filamentus]
MFVAIDLLKAMKIRALQINFQNFNSEVFGRPKDLKQQFIIEGSLDGKKWNVIADYSKNERDMPHAYIELKKTAEARFVRYKHVYCHNKYLAISEFRVFGNGNEAKPATPNNFKVARQKDRRNTNLTWDAVKDATGYVIYWGIAKDKLNLSALIYNKPNYELRALTTDQKYYYQVEAFNENGISVKSEILSTE